MFFSTWCFARFPAFGNHGSLVQGFSYRDLAEGSLLMRFVSRFSLAVIPSGSPLTSLRFLLWRLYEFRVHRPHCHIHNFFDVLFSACRFVDFTFRGLQLRASNWTTARGYLQECNTATTDEHITPVTLSCSFHSKHSHLLRRQFDEGKDHHSGFRFLSCAAGSVLGAFFFPVDSDLHPI